MDNEKTNLAKKQRRQNVGGIAEAKGYYQSKVAAWVAINILMGSEWVNLWDLPISITLDRVECQVRQPVDDIMVTTSDHGHLFIQCKTRLDFGESPDSEFASVFDQFVRQFLKSNETRYNKSNVGLDSRPGRTLEYDRDRLILVTTSGSSSKVVKTLPKILLRIRSSIEGDPFEKIALNKDEEDTLKILCQHIDVAWEKYESIKPSNEETRALLKLCWVQILDLDQGLSSEWGARELLRSITSSPEHAENAWNILLNHFACCHENAIGATRSQLEDLLSKKNNIPLNLKGQEFVSHWTFQKGDMPKFPVERKKEIKEIMKWIEADDKDSNNSTHLVIHGMGGVGKSTLVAMACELAYEQLQCLYPDGVHWIKLGSHTSVLNSIHDFLAKLEEKAALQTRDGVRDYLEKYLRNRKLLLIIDDAWNAEDLEIFKFTGISRAIITTRFKNFAEYFQWSSYELNGMSKSEAVELLSKKLDQKKVKSNKKILENLAEAVDYLPLALHLLEPLLRDNPWEEILDELQHPIKRLELLEPVGDELGAKQSLVNTFLLSLDKIKPDLRKKFAWIGILADNTPINPTMAGTLWGDLSGPLVNKKLRALEQRSLILYIGEGSYGDIFRLHKLIHDMARCFLFRKEEAIDPSDRIKSMNLSLKEAHWTLLERYRGKLKNKRNGESWYNLPDDGYIHSNLFYHLEQAQQVDQQYRVLTEENDRRENGWFAAKLDLGQVHGFWRDMEMAWRHAEIEGDLKKQVLYALMASSLVSKTNELPITLLEAALRYNVISGEESLAYARRISTPEIRMKANLEVALVLKEAERKEAIKEAVDALIFTEDSFGERRYAVYSFVRYIQNMGIEPVDQIDRVHEVARKINDRKDKLEALLDLVPIITGEHTRVAIIEEVWKSAVEMKDGTELLVSCLSYLPDTLLPSPKDELLRKLAPRDRAKVLAGLMKRSSTPSREMVGEEWLIALDQVDNEMDKEHLLTEAAQVLPESIRTRAIERACSIGNEWVRAQALSAFAGYLSLDQMKIALQSSRYTLDGMDSVKVLAALSIHLPDSLESEARTVAMTMEKESSRAPALISLSRRFPSLKTTLLQLEETLPVDALKNIGPFESIELEEAVLEYAEGLEVPLVRAAAYIDLAGCFDGDKKRRLLHLAIDAAKNVESLEKRIKLACRLISSPIEGEIYSFLQEVIESILAEVRLRLADRIKSTVNEFNFNLAYNRRQNQDSLARSLVKIVEALPEEVKPAMFHQALKVFQVVGPEPAHLILLWHLVDNIGGEDKLAVLKEILQLTRFSGDEPLKVASLIGLAKRSEALLEICLEEANILKSAGCREVFRAGILEYLKRNTQENLLNELLASLRSEKTGSRERTVEVIRELGRFIVKNMPERLPELHSTILSFHDQWDLVRGLEAIVVHLTPPQLLEAVKMVEMVEMPAARAEGCAVLAPYLELPQKDEIFDCFLSMNSVLRWAGLLVKLAPKLPEHFHSKAFEMARALENQKCRAEALCGLCLAPNLSKELIKKIYMEIRGLDFSKVSSKDLVHLLPKLPAQERTELVEIAMQMAPGIGHEWTCSHLLSRLLPSISDRNTWEKALEIAQKIKGKDQKANALTAFAMTSLAGISYIDAALKASLDVEHWYNDRFDILKRINQPMKKLGVGDRKELLGKALRISSEKPRNDLFMKIAALLPSFRSLDSTIDIAIYKAIGCISRWWP